MQEFFSTFLANFTLLIKVGVSIQSYSEFKISKSNLRSVFLHLFFERCQMWQVISFHSLAPKRNKDSLYDSREEL